MREEIIAVLVLLAGIGAGLLLASSGGGEARLPENTGNLPGHTELRSVLRSVVATENGGFGFEMWATIVDRDGEVRTVAFSGDARGDQWPGSRIISAQKANTANDYSLPELALSTANLYSAVQPGNSLYGLPFSNPVDTDVAYAGPPEVYGTIEDPLIGHKVGGVNVFGGGLPLYAPDGRLLGALGLSGDTSCADHIKAWKVRHRLNLDNVPAGNSPTNDDNIVFDITEGRSESGWGHPECSTQATDVARQLPQTHPTGPNP